MGIIEFIFTKKNPQVEYPKGIRIERVIPRPVEIDFNAWANAIHEDIKKCKPDCDNRKN